jgi:hypothetical protein
MLTATSIADNAIFVILIFHLSMEERISAHPTQAQKSVSQNRLCAVM